MEPVCVERGYHALQKPRSTTNTTDMSTANLILSPLGQAALAYAAQNWAVFPCVPKGKAPLTPNGYKDATTDAHSISAWWERWPNANIGYAIPPSLVVIDIDPRNGGEPPSSLPSTLVTLTGGSGEHYYYNLPDSSETKTFKRTYSDGVDIKVHGGYVLLPPSVTANKYKFQSVGDSRELQACIANIPDWLLEGVTKPAYESSRIPKQEYNDPTDNRPGSVYNRTAAWADILSPHGWVCVAANGEEEYWRRPGKSEGISATTNYNGSELLYVFSSSTIFEAEQGYSKFAAYSLLAHNGDYTAAAATLANIPSSGLAHSVPPAATINMKEYIFNPAPLPEDHFVTRFVDYVERQTDAPKEYAEASALVLLSLAAYKCRAALSPYPGGLSPNLYIALVGPTTQSRKSTVQRIATDIAKSVVPSAVLPNRATTEALIKALADRSGTPSVWLPDEFGVTLAEIYNRDYMRGLEEMLLTVYSGDDYAYQRVMDSVYIKLPSLSVLGAATPESISRAGTTALDSGLLPRFAVVYPAVMPKPRAVADAVDLTTNKVWLVNKLSQILTWANSRKAISFEPEALVYLNEAEAHLTGSGAARLPTMLYKVSTLLTAADTRANVTLNDAQAATVIVNRWAQGIADLIPQMYRHGSDQQFEQQLDYVSEELRKAGGVLLRVTLANTINVKKQRLDELEFTLIDKGRIWVENINGVKTWHLN